MQNAPHDSICGCSVDEVHREMETRFAKVNQVGEFIKGNLLEEWKQKLDSRQAESDLLFTVVNTGLHDKVDTVSVDVTFATCDFKEAHPTEAYQRMADLTIPDFIVKDLDGRSIEAKIEDLGANFNMTYRKIAFVRLILPASCA